MEDEQKYPINIVSMKTGLSAFVIRAWEKRYKAVNPDRTSTNRRLYSQRDIDKLHLLNSLTQNGYNIGGIAKLSIDELNKLAFGKQFEPAEKKGKKISGNFDQEYLESLLNAIKNFDAKSLELELLKMSAEFSQTELIEKVLVPLIYAIGEQWKNGSIRIVNEHMATVIISNFIINLQDTYKLSEHSPKIIIATPKGQFHELGALLVAATAAAEGWYAVYLGSDLSSIEISSAVKKIGAKVLALSIVYPSDDPLLVKEFSTFKNLLPNDVTVIAGGYSSEMYRSILEGNNILVINDLQKLRSELESIRRKVK